MPVRFALIGCGKATERLALPQLSACPEAHVTALVDIDRTAAERLAQQGGIDRRLIWSDWKRMLREAEVDAVAVCLPNVLHAEVTIAALEAGKHVMVEKPIAITLAEADAMIRAARAHRRWLMVNHPHRFEPAHEMARSILRSELLGPITRLRGRLGHAGPEYWSDTSPWFTDPAQAGGGALLDIGIHLIDLLRWLSGKSVKRVCAHAKTLEKQVPVEDNAGVLLEWTDGTLGSFEVSWTTRPYEVTTTLYGQRGTLATSLGAEHPVAVRFCQLEGDPNKPLGDPFYPHIPASSRFGSAYASFAQSILGNTPPSISGEEGRANLEVMLAAYESIRTGGWVELPLPLPSPVNTQRRRTSRTSHARRVA